MMQEMTSQANKEKCDQMPRDLRRWLSPPDPWKNHNIACDAHHDGTTTWFIESDTFAEWISSDSPLWIRGKPGAGKTILCSTIVNNIEGLCKSGLASLEFFYCDFRDDENKDRACSPLFFPNSMISPTRTARFLFRTPGWLANSV
ncbi:hypothetical protein BJV78DRAFT_133736 [Lactifluus subvellereus]|nr:hypothetical protein BJV78DRAFT_133736 [Lactifluus subvellereus]